MSFSVDPLSSVMIVLALFMTGCSYAYGNWKTPAQRWAPWSFCLFACLSAIASDWLVFIFFMELSSFALAAMIGKKDRPAAWIYLYSQLIGGALLLLAVAIGSAGGPILPMGPVPSGLFPLFVLALGFKAALPILHFWLPIAHGRASAEVSAVLSGYAVKMGIYGLLRVADGPSVSLLCIGAVMALYGVFQALMQHDGKRLLAYHTMSQLGFIVAAIGSGTALGRAAAMAHLVSHCLFKGLLFLTAGGLEDSYGTRDLRYLGMAAREVPLLFALFLVGATSIAGFPGTSGYVSKSLIKLSLGDYPAVMWSLQIAGVGTVLSFCKFGIYGYLRAARPGIPGAPLVGKPSSIRFKVMVAMAVATLGVGFFHRWLPFFPVDGPSLWKLGKALSASYPIVVGSVIFATFPRVFSPGDGHFPDVEDLLSRLGYLCLEPLSFMRDLHCGRLRLYLAVAILSGLSILWFLSF